MSKTIFLAGHGALPQGMAAKGLYEHIAVVAEIDRKHGVIVNAQCTLITELANSFVQKALIGYCLEDGIDDAVSEIIDVYHGAARNALIAALKDLNREFLKYRESAVSPASGALNKSR